MMPRCEMCGRPITTEEFDNYDGKCTDCANESEEPIIY